MQNFWEKVFQDKNGTSSFSSFKVWYKQLSTKPCFQRRSHARGSLLYIDNIQNHAFYMLLGSYPFRLRGVWGSKIFILCIGTRSRTFMCKTFRPRKSDFTFKILQDLSTNVCNTPLDSLIQRLYSFSLLPGSQWSLLVGLAYSVGPSRVHFIVFHNQWTLLLI